MPQRTGRRRGHAIAAIGLIVAMTSTAFAAPPAAKDTKPSGTRPRIEKRTYDFREADARMEYALYVPSGYAKSKNGKFPLIIALHGLGSNPQQIMRYPGLVGLAEKHGYIVAAPMGYNFTGWYGSRGPGLRGTKLSKVAKLSEQDVLNVLEIVVKEHRIDADRIYLMGHSMGGGGTWHLGIKYPDRWAALAPIAPAIYRSPDELTAIKHLPVIVVQGEKDPLVPARTTRKWVAKMKELKMTHVYIEVKNGGHIFPAFTKLPDIFKFFNKHRRSRKRSTGD